MENGEPPKSLDILETYKESFNAWPVQMSFFLIIISISPEDNLKGKCTDSKPEM